MQTLRTCIKFNNIPLLIHNTLIKRPPMNSWNCGFASLLIGLTGMCSSLSHALELTYGVPYHGGKIACLVDKGEIDNLIVSAIDLSKGISWGGQGQVIGPAAQSDTDGAANTLAIVNALGVTSEYAARLCQDYEIDSKGFSPCRKENTCYDDWFLPAKNQLNCVFDHKDAIGGFAKDRYWTSTEFSGYPAYSAWDKYFSNEKEPSRSDYDSNRVRCVRTFVW